MGFSEANKWRNLEHFSAVEVKDKWSSRIIRFGDARFGFKGLRNGFWAIHDESKTKLGTTLGTVPVGFSLDAIPVQRSKESSREAPSAMSSRAQRKKITITNRKRIYTVSPTWCALICPSMLQLNAPFSIYRLLVSLLQLWAERSPDSTEARISYGSDRI